MKLQIVLVAITAVHSLVITSRQPAYTNGHRRRVHQPSTMVFGKVLRAVRGGQGGEGLSGSKGIKVAVVGASGNVGKCVTNQLISEGYDVTAIVRSMESGDKLYEYLTKNVWCPQMPKIMIADVSNPAEASSLQRALKGAERVVVCTGTTAFPTTAWAGGGISKKDVRKTVWDAYYERSFDRELTMQYLTSIGMNTPAVVDHQGIERVASCLDEKAVDRIVLMSSLGVSRRLEFPFTVLNACGVLDAKAKGEAALINAARKIGADWTIVRPGQLFGEPYTNNKYIGTLFQLDKDDYTRAVEFKKGDSGAGDTLRGSLANVLVQTLKNEATRNTDFTVLTVKGRAPTEAALDAQLSAALA